MDPKQFDFVNVNLPKMATWLNVPDSHKDLLQSDQRHKAMTLSD